MVGKDMDKPETSVRCWGTCKMMQHCGKHCGVSSKQLKIEVPYDSAIPLLGTHPEELKTGSHRDICPPVFMTASFTVAKM